jgi:hypothetical protein
MFEIEQELFFDVQWKELDFVMSSCNVHISQQSYYKIDINVSERYYYQNRFIKKQNKKIKREPDENA